MATHMQNENTSSLDIEIRPRRVSERSEAISEAGSHPHLPGLFPRRRLLRSLTDAQVLQMNPSVDEDTIKQSEITTSREYLSRNESSSSGDVPADDKKTMTTSQEESGGSKDIPEEVKKQEVERDTSSDVPMSETRQDSSERPTRQTSRSRSESDDATHLAPPGMQKGVKWADPRVSMIAGSTGGHPRSALLAMRNEYTSITDELEGYCGLLSPPRTPPVSPPPSRAKHVIDMSDPEVALQFENEHLRDAEAYDYQQMEGLIQRRYRREDDDSDDDVVPPPFYIANEHRLRRATAIDEEAKGTVHQRRRATPTISVTREIEQTLARPPAIRDTDAEEQNDPNNPGPAPASETMC